MLARIVGGLGAAAAALLGWGWFEAGWVRLRTVDVRGPRTAARARRACASRTSPTSTSACRPAARRAVERAVAWVEERQPDLVLLTGDLLTHPRGEPKLRELLRRLGPRTYAVLGNHDFGDARDPLAAPSRLEDLSPAHLLRDDSVELELRGRRVQLVGVDPVSYRSGRADPDGRADDDADLRILLCHYPNVFHRLRSGSYHARARGPSARRPDRDSVRARKGAPRARQLALHEGSLPARRLDSARVARARHDVRAVSLLRAPGGDRARAAPGRPSLLGEVLGPFSLWETVVDETGGAPDWPGDPRAPDRDGRGATLLCPFGAPLRASDAGFGARVGWTCFHDPSCFRQVARGARPEHPRVGTQAPSVALGDGEADAGSVVFREARRRAAIRARVELVRARARWSGSAHRRTRRRRRATPSQDWDGPPRQVSPSTCRSARAPMSKNGARRVKVHCATTFARRRGPGGAEGGRGGTASGTQRGRGGAAGGSKWPDLAWRVSGPPTLQGVGTAAAQTAELSRRLRYAIATERFRVALFYVLAALCSAAIGLAVAIGV